MAPRRSSKGRSVALANERNNEGSLIASDLKAQANLNIKIVRTYSKLQEYKIEKDASDVYDICKDDFSLNHMQSNQEMSSATPIERNDVVPTDIVPASDKPEIEKSLDNFSNTHDEMDIDCQETNEVKSMATARDNSTNNRVSSTIDERLHTDAQGATNTQQTTFQQEDKFTPQRSSRRLAAKRSCSVLDESPRKQRVLEVQDILGSNQETLDTMPTELRVLIDPYHKISTPRTSTPKTFTSEASTPTIETNAIKLIEKDDYVYKEYYCLCRSTETSEFMIFCDNCEEWYHYSCLGIRENSIETKDDKNAWYCPECIKTNASRGVILKPRIIDDSKRNHIDMLIDKS